MTSPQTSLVDRTRHELAGVTGPTPDGARASLSPPGRTRRMSLRPLRVRPQRLLLVASALVAIAGTGVVASATAAPQVRTWYHRIDTGGSFLPTTGPQRTVIIGPDGAIYAAPDKTPPHP